MGVLLEGFLLGNASILTNVCLLPLYPGLIAFLAGNANDERSRRTMGWLGLLVLLGVLTMMLVIGLVFSALSSLYLDILPFVVVISYLLVTVLGVMMLAGYNPFARLATIQAPILQNRPATAFLYGLLLAPMTLPCTGPILLAALARGSASAGALFTEISFFLAFGFGFGWPLVLLPLLAVPFQRRFTGWMTSNYQTLTRVAGMLLAVIGVWGLYVDRELVYAVFGNNAVAILLFAS